MDKLEFEYLGPYKVEGILGRGGMGTVYKGRHARSGDLVAIKVIAPVWPIKCALGDDSLPRLKR